MIYFGGGPVLRVPFAWYHVCLTINYMQSRKEAIRSVELNTIFCEIILIECKQIFRKIYVNGELNFDVTTKFLPEVPVQSLVLW